jgi:DNA mismatch repair ATPase MutS
MEIDITTLNDLNILSKEENYSLFEKINFTRTSNGEIRLQQNLSKPFNNVAHITGIQQTLQVIINAADHWPLQISNGTILMVEKFYDSNIDTIPENPSAYQTYLYKLLHSPDFSLIKYSVSHFFDFIKGLDSIIKLLSDEENASPLQQLLHELRELLNKENCKSLFNKNSSKEFSNKEILNAGYFFLYRYKHQTKRLLQLHAQLDAWYGMAMAVKQCHLIFPEIQKSNQPYIYAEGLYHLLLEKPVPYDIKLDKDKNFMFLTGANMAGKSTFIKSTGTAVYLAHLGMGVPAQKMELSLLDGILSNINIMDNLSKGESYFFNEVQRIKSTITKINDGRQWLILIDELFKGTNVEDAMKCSSIVIEGLVKIPESIFILSTHLYEIGEALKRHSNISFNYFETQMIHDEFKFSYQLKEGISNDRLGYLILKKEGVVAMLEKKSPL